MILLSGPCHSRYTFITQQDRLVGLDDWRDQYTARRLRPQRINTGNALMISEVFDPLYPDRKSPIPKW